MGQDKAVAKFARGDMWKIAASGRSLEYIVNEVMNENTNQFFSRPDGYALLEKHALKTHPVRSVIAQHKWDKALPEEPEGFAETAWNCYT